jgi:hypothetical protein
MIQIVVADHGWVFVGSVGDGNPMEEVNPCRLKNAHCIRVWGTSNGLGELRNGPTEKTILDPMGNLNVTSVLFTMEVSQDAWLNVIN